MKTIFVFLFIIILASAIAIHFKHRIEETIVVAIMGVILVLYFSGLVCGGNLLPGVYICLLLGGGALLYVVKSIITDRDGIKTYCLVPGLLIYFFLFGWIWYINRYRVFSSWDEFSHWGLVVKNMDFFDWFGNHPLSTVSFQGYPPATALWQYFIGKLYGGFYEGHVYQATGWLVASLCMPVASRLEWKSIFRAFFSVCFLIAVPMIFNGSYLVLLYVDVLLGILLGYILYCGFYSKSKDVFYYVNIGIALCVLTITKASGTFLALVAIAVIQGYEFVNEAEEKQEISIKRNLIILIGFLAAVFVGKMTWSLYLNLTETGEAWNTSSMTISNIFNLILGKGEEYQYTTISNFLNALGETDFNSYIFNMRYVSWVVVAMALFFVLNRLVKEKARLRFYAWGSMIGLAVYTVGLMLLYVFTYTEYEAVNLASFQRYLATYFVTLAYFISGVLFIEVNKRKNQFVKKTIMAASGVLLLFVPVNAFWDVTFLYKEQVNMTVSQRDVYIEVMPYLEKLNYFENKIWFISQNTSGFDYWYLKYLVTPIEPAGGGIWSLGKPYSENDMYTINLTVEEWLDNLEKQNGTHVYLHYIDTAFIEQYSDAFESESEIEQGCMYSLELQEDKKYLKKVILEDN